MHQFPGNFGTTPRMDWVGIVEDRADPLQDGRVRVRIHGFHTDDTTRLPTEHLPWAIVTYPVTSAIFSGVGRTPHRLMVGSMVTGHWLDWPSCQFPCVSGVWSQVECGGGGMGNGGRGNGLISRRPDGSIGVNDSTPAGGPGTINPVGSGPKWLQIAQGELAKGIKETSGSSHNPEVLKYGKDFGFTTDDSQHPWCAAFTYWCLKQAGQDTNGLNGMAKSAMTASCMKKISEPILGCIAVRHRGSPSSGSGHVGFWVGRSGGNDKYLGGNQSNRVSISAKSLNKHAGYYWPVGAPMPSASDAGGAPAANFNVNDTGGAEL